MTCKVPGLGSFPQPIRLEPRAQGSKGEEHELKCRGQSGARLHKGPRGQVKNLEPYAESSQKLLFVSAHAQIGDLNHTVVATAIGPAAIPHTASLLCPH